MNELTKDEVETILQEMQWVVAFKGIGNLDKRHRYLYLLAAQLLEAWDKDDEKEGSEERIQELEDEVESLAITAARLQDRIDYLKDDLEDAEALNASLEDEVANLKEALAEARGKS